MWGVGITRNLKRPSIWWDYGLVAFLSLALCCISSAHSQPFTELVVFGDSHSDTGNWAEATEWGMDPWRCWEGDHTPSDVQLDPGDRSKIPLVMGRVVKREKVSWANCSKRHIKPTGFSLLTGL